MSNNRSVCVILGSRLGEGEHYIDSAKQLGKLIAERNMTLIYGGGKLGLMGILANEVLNNGGQVIGVITNNLLQSEGHSGLTKLHVVSTMQERKLLMAELSDGCIALPGGLGTLEEFFEFWNALKLGIYNKPIGILNINNYYDKLFEFLSGCIEQNFMKKDQLSLISVKQHAIDLLDIMFARPETTQFNDAKYPVRLLV